MTPAQQVRALRYVSRHLPATPIRRTLVHQLSTESTGRQQTDQTPKPSRWDLSSRRAEKLPDGRIITVRDRSRPRRERVLTVLVIVLAGALSASLLFFITQWSPTFRPTNVASLQATSAAAGARAALFSDSDRMLLVAENLPTPAAGFRYVAWRGTTDGWIRAGTLVSVAPNTYRLDAPIGANEPVEITIERSGGDQDARGPVMLEGLTSP